MTKKDDKIKDNSLEASLEEAKNNAEKKEINIEASDYEKKIKFLENALAEKEEIAKKAQYSYINLKMDFDGYVKRKEENSANEKTETLFSVVKKFLPFVESLRKSIDTIPEKNHDDPMPKGVILTYNKFLSTLDTMGIKQIEAIGLDPDSELHEPVSMQPTENKKLKGKIIQEFEKGFFFEKDGVKKVITTSKVIIGQ